MKAIPLTQYTVTDSFWQPLMEKVRTVMLPYQWEALNDRVPGAEKSYCIQNFRIAAGQAEGEHGGFVFQDSDLYKWLEAVGYSLAIHPDAALQATADEVIGLIAAAQQPDGYLNTYYTINGLDKRWTNLRDNHELYCAGHLIEAAVAYYNGTGKRALLDVAIRFVDHIEGQFGAGPGKKRGYPGHEVIEMALVALYNLTKEERFLALAKYFIDERGRQPNYFAAEHGYPAQLGHTQDHRYWQAQKPVREQQHAEGHAVRAMYLYSGAADVARETGDEELMAACRRLWASTVHKRMYITGGIGSTHIGEAFTFDYDLPNDTAYTETCASIGLVFFARRLLEAGPSREAADVMERALFNGILSGMTQDAKHFFYVNPLEVLPQACTEDMGKRHVKPERQAWFGCACCPPNLARLVTSIGGYAAAQSADTVYLNLYLGGELALEGGAALSIESGLPYKGAVTIKVKGTLGKRLALRLPGWSGATTAALNGRAVDAKGEYLVLDTADGDEITLCFSMAPKHIRANPNVTEDIGKVALMRGPLVYCMEQADNFAGLHRAAIDTSSPVDELDAPFPGAVLLQTRGSYTTNEGWPEGALYAPCPAPAEERRTLRFIPYYLWANRGLGEMAVWVREC